MSMIDFAERRLVPDWFIRLGIRHLLRSRLKQEKVLAAANPQHAAEFVEQLSQSPLAIATDAANRQHYEEPADFFQLALGARLKYSCGWFDDERCTLDAAERRMLQITCERAEIVDGMQVLELGCGWGSLTLWLAEHFPDLKITAVSNSHNQRRYIEEQCRQRDWKHVKVITADMRTLQLDSQFDRVVSIEMFEHMRNYALLLQRISGWLLPDGKLFVHLFCHRQFSYLFETEGASNWMGRHFFTGGMMPAEQLLTRFNEHLQVQHQWSVNGVHYGRTCEAWLKNLNRRRGEALQIFSQTMEGREAARHVQRWRIFFMACAELFRYRQGQEWFVAHYLLSPKQGRAAVDHVPTAK